MSLTAAANPQMFLSTAAVPQASPSLAAVARMSPGPAAVAPMRKSTPRRRVRRARQRGQTLVIFALAMALMLFGMFCMVVDVSVLYTQSARVQSAAQDAALSGANVVSSCSLFHSTTPQLDTGNCATEGNTTLNYADVCKHAGDLSAGITSASGGSGTTCTNSGNLVTASVVKVVALPLALFGMSATVRSTFQAAPVAGTDQPDCALTGSCPSPPP